MTLDPSLENEEHTIGPTFDTAELEISLLSRKRRLEMRRIVLHNQCNSPWHSVLKGFMGTILGLYHWSDYSFKKFSSQAFASSLQDLSSGQARIFFSIRMLGMNVCCNVAFFGVVRTFLLFTDVFRTLYFVGVCSAFLLANTAAWTGLRFIFRWKFFFRIYLIGSVTMMSFWCFCYIFWTKVLHLNYPVPLIGALNSLVGFLSNIVALWFCFPKDWRNIPKIQHKLFYLTSSQLLVIFLSFEYWIFSWCFHIIPWSYQWTLGVILPITREIGGGLLTKISSKAGAKDSNLVVSTSISMTFHTLFLSVCIADSATNQTIILLLLIDFLIKVGIVFKIYQLKRDHDEQNVNKICELVQILVLTELFEIIIPLGYVLCLLAAYFGPNAHLLGNIKNSYWQFHQLSNIEISFINLLLLIAIDSVYFSVSFIVLYYVSNINIFKVLLYLLDEYGIIFAIHQAFLLEYLFCTIAIACAFDFTLEFNWIHEQISNTTRS